MTNLSGIAVRFAGVSRHFGEVRAVDGVSFEIHDGDLSMLALPVRASHVFEADRGFEQPDSGNIVIMRQCRGVQP